MVLALVMVLSLSASFAFAAGGITPYRTSSVSINPVRVSDTYGVVDVDVTFSTTADEYSVAIVLQQKNGSTWATAVGAGSPTEYFRGTNRKTVYCSDSWNLLAGKLYRVKVVSTDYYDSGSSYTTTTYSDPF